MPETPKTVLMIQLDSDQGKLWQSALMSQGLNVDWKPAEVDLLEFFKDAQDFGWDLPDLLLLDIGVKSPTSNSLQAVPVCQWCKNMSPPLKVMLLNVNSLQIKPYEYKWATGKCGAVGILPKLTQATLLNSVGLVASVLDTELLPDQLDPVSLLIAEIYAQNLQSQENNFSEILEALSIARTATIIPETEYPQAVTTYRGAVVNAKLHENIDPETTMQVKNEDLNGEKADVKQPTFTSYRGVKIEQRN
jgi:hypothetical protein